MPVQNFNCFNDHLYRLHPAGSSTEKVLESNLISPELAKAIEQGDIREAKFVPIETTFYFLFKDGQNFSGYYVRPTKEEMESYQKRLEEGFKKCIGSYESEKLKLQIVKEIGEKTSPKSNIPRSEAKNLADIVSKLASSLWSD